MIEWVLAFSVRRRWYVLLFTIAAAMSGAWALTVLPIDAVPDITNVQVQVNAFAPALSPLEVEKQVTFPIEVALAGTPGLEKTWSFSRNGFAQVTAVFSERTDIYFARQQVTERLSDAKNALPPGVDIKMGPISTGLGEIYWWTVEYAQPGDDARDGAPGWQSDGSYLTPEGERLADELSRLVYLRTVQDWIIRPQLKTVRGVAGADAIGGYVKQYQVEPDPAKLVGYGLSISQLVTAIEGNNASRGANYIERFGEGYVVRTNGRVEKLAEIGDIVVAARGDIPIHVKDVAQVTIGRDLRLGSASMNGHEAVLGTVLMLVGGNSRTVAAAVDAKINEINRTLPPAIRVRTVLNRTQLVDATVQTVATNLLEGALLVIMVLLLLLGNFRAALITALVIPVTMLITAMGMLQVKLSANLMSLGALDFGLIVDGAVIIAENSLRHLAERQRQLGRALVQHERLDTVTESANEVIRPTVYGQFIIGLVYLPLLTFSGVEGKTFQPMALTVLIALVTAFVLSLTFMPAMIAIFVTGKVSERDNGFVRGLKALYRPVLSAVIRRPTPAIAVGILTFACAVLLFSRLGQEFIPKLDEKNIVMEVKRIPSTSLSQSQTMQFVNERMIGTFPQVAFVFSRGGTPDLAADPMPPSATDTYIILKPRQEWPDPDLPKNDLIRDIADQAATIPGNKVGFSQPIQMRFNELIAGVREDLAVSVFGDEFEPMLRAANQIAAVLQGVRGTTEVKVEDVVGMPVLEINIDKAEIARHALSLSAVQDVIGIAVGGRPAGLVFEGDRRFQIVVRLADVERNNIEVLKNLPVPLPGSSAHAGEGAVASTLPLRVLADFNLSEGPNQVSRENGKRRVVVTADVRGRDIGSAVAEAQAKIAQKVTLPPGYWLTWGGQFENFTAARQRLIIVVPVCFALIFLLLLGALGSWRDALLVSSAVPLALTGGVTALWLRDMAFSISSAVGFIALSGVAVLNGLVMITFIRQLVDEGVQPREAIYRGALTRLRPVVMTALVASLGFVPMAIATGTGAEVQKPLATVVIGGLISATLLTLLVLPALYARFSGIAIGDEKKPRLVNPSRLPPGESDATGPARRTAPRPTIVNLDTPR
jgi:cobalt-zinc-cadmium resistance protein CzcA